MCLLLSARARRTKQGAHGCTQCYHSAAMALQGPKGSEIVTCSLHQIGWLGLLLFHELSPACTRCVRAVLWNGPQLQDQLISSCVASSQRQMRPAAKVFKALCYHCLMDMCSHEVVSTEELDLPSNPSSLPRRHQQKAGLQLQGRPHGQSLGTCFAAACTCRALAGGGSHPLAMPGWQLPCKILICHYPGLLRRYQHSKTVASHSQPNAECGVSRSW